MRRCLTCLQRYRERWAAAHHKPQPDTTGLCGAGLHAWVPENWYVNHKAGTRQCKPCQLGRAYTHARDKRYINVLCMVKGCTRHTRRLAAHAAYYLCPGHRIDPPPVLLKLARQLHEQRSRTGQFLQV